MVKPAEGKLAQPVGVELAAPAGVALAEDQGKGRGGRTSPSRGVWFTGVSASVGVESLHLRALTPCPGEC